MHAGGAAALLKRLVVVHDSEVTHALLSSYKVQQMHLSASRCCLWLSSTLCVVRRSSRYSSRSAPSFAYVKLCSQNERFSLPESRYAKQMNQLIFTHKPPLSLLQVLAAYYLLLPVRDEAAVALGERHLQQSSRKL